MPPPHPSTVTFRFYAELNDFLPPAHRFQDIAYSFSDSPPVKDAIEALGVPHPEVEAIIVTSTALAGVSVDFNYRLRPDDRIAVYPVFEAIDVTPLIRLRPEPLRRTCFILDTHLGKLARQLRLLGFDTLYRNDLDDHEIVHISVKDHRIALTRDRGLLKHRELTHGYCVRSTSPTEQTREVLKRFDLHGAVKPFTRCTVCNHPIEKVPKGQIEDRLEPGTCAEHDEFHYCAGCNRVYWKGAHLERLQRLVDRLVDLPDKG